MSSRPRAGSPLRASKLLASILIPLLPIVGSGFLIPRSDPSSGTIASTSTPLSWTGTATGFGSADESTCIEGTNCDTFTLNVDGTQIDWAGKYIQIKVDWTIGANDYDLYIHKGAVDGRLVASSGSGAPSTEEAAAIDPATSGTGAYTVHVVYFVGTPGSDQYKAVASVQNAPLDGRTAIHLTGGMSFSTNTTLRCPVSEADGEPSLRVDKLGNAYAVGIRGVPAGVDLWYFDLNPSSPTFDPNMRNPIYRGQPDSFTKDEALSVGADGGGDVDIAVGFNTSGIPKVAFTSLTAANVACGMSSDLGLTWTLNPFGSATGGVPVDDRQWIEFFGDNIVYLLYRTFEPAVTQIQQSVDGGITYGPAVTAGQIGQVGSVDVDQNDGTVYVAGSTGMVAVGVPAAPGLPPATYNVYQAVSDPYGVAHLFVVVKVADDGTAYVAYSNARGIYLTHSKDKGVTWAPAVRVSDGPDTACAIFPWMETGPTPGSVGIVWYGTSKTLPSDDTANWNAFYAISYDATATVPTFEQSILSDHVIHAGNISEGGLLGSDNRNLLDYFQIAFDPQGAAVIAYSDDHNDFSGFVNVARQITGPSIKGGHLGPQVEGSQLPPPQQYGPEQVTDFRQDVAYGLLGVVPADDPFDILSIRYSSRSTPNTPTPIIRATMKVSDLSVIPPNGTWRMCFTANSLVPNPDNKDYSFGLADRGDMYFLRATTDQTGTQAFKYGKVARNTDGSLTYTVLGDAAGSFDSATNTIMVEVDSIHLTSPVARIRYGSVLCGLRGQAFDTGSQIAKRDSTRGGRSYTVAFNK